MRLSRLLYPAAFLLSLSAASQTAGPVALPDDLRTLVNLPGVTGYEGAVSRAVEAALQGMHPQRDAMGNVIVTFGSGAPHRLIAASLDEPGYVVSKIEADGYLRVQSLPQSGLPPHFHEMENAQQMVLTARDGKSVPAVVAGASIHLTPGRKDIPNPDDLDAMYIDTGAKSAAEVLRSGVDVLSPMAAERVLLRVGSHRYVGTSVGDRYGAAVLLQLARSLAGKPLQGSVTLAFTTQHWSGTRGLTRVLEQQRPDELVYVGRGRRDARAPATAQPALGSGTVHFHSPGEIAWPEMDGVTAGDVASAAIVQRGYGPAAVLPAHTAHLGVPVRYPLTAAEMVDGRDLEALLQSLLRYTGVTVVPAPILSAVTPMPFPIMPARPSGTPATLDVLRALTLSYGVSEQETMTRETVARLLPAWAKPETDKAGNLILRMGHGKSSDTVFMAHTDELGFRIRSINPDGSLELNNKGGGSPAFYWGHPALVHTAAGSLPSVVTVPDNFDTAEFHFPADFRAAAKLDVGAASAEEVAAQGIRVGDTVTIPKRFHTLADGRVTVRSLDDRVGCTALVRAVWQLGEKFDRNVTFVWSTQEELGLLGAVAYAQSAAAAGQVPATVFAIDTFVSADSPLESHRFADAVLGAGFVIRAVDNSNIVPWTAVQRVQRIADAHRIPVQYGITGGGNDGAAFQRYGSTDVALSWPLRYSHSPAELVDMRDVDALADITLALAREW